MNLTKITLAISISLYNAIDKILVYSDKDNQNPIPANVKFKLIKCKDILERDKALYELKRTELIRKLGVDDGNGMTRVPEDKIEEFRNSLFEEVKTEVSHAFDKIESEDMKYIKADNLLSEELNIFALFMVNDEDLNNELGIPTVGSDDTEEDTKEEETTPTEE